VAPVLPWLTTALRQQVELLPSYDVGRRARLLRRARRVSRRASLMARSYKNNAPHALRERALIEALFGNERRARRLLARSLAAAERQDATYEQALTRQAWGRLGVPLGWPDAQPRLTEADAEIAALVPGSGGAHNDAGVPSPSLSLADRFATLLAVGRRIASAPSPVAVYAAVREAAVTLLRGERCHVLEVGGDLGTGATTISGTHIDKLSQSVVTRALERGGPVLLSDAEPIDSADSIVLSGVRSALCAPIFCEGRAVACLYVTHSQVSGLFGVDEIQLTEFIATLAGAALDHVAGSEARFRSLSENSSDVITIVDRRASISYQSSAVTQVFGFQPGDLIGTELVDWLHPDDVPVVRALLHEAVTSGTAPSLFECRMCHHDGTWRDAETAISNLLDDPSVNGLVLNSRDITHRKRTERELLETLDREHDMRERLQEADRIKTDFVSAVSHELRTPLSSILGYLEMLEDGGSGPLDAEQARVLDVVDRNARRLLALIEDLLTISRVESGTFRLELEPVEIQSLVDAAHQAVMPSLAGRDLDLRVDVGEGTGSILGDAAHLDRLLINLLTNAIKFTPDGGRVALSAHRVDGTVVIEVSDTGIGIPLEEQVNLFERFFRSSSARRLAVPGTGLGLSITKKVVEDHGGEISVSSIPGKGTTMTVRLPVTPAAGPGLVAA
jgi:PAS domain S-box-containing protein